MGLPLELRPASYIDSHQQARKRNLNYENEQPGRAQYAFMEKARKNPQICPCSHTNPCQDWKLPSQSQICPSSHTDGTWALAFTTWLVGSPVSHRTRPMGKATLKGFTGPVGPRRDLHRHLLQRSQVSPWPGLPSYLQYAAPITPQLFHILQQLQHYSCINLGAFRSELLQRVRKPGYMEAGLGI